MTPAELRQRLAEFARDVAIFTKPLLRSIDTQDVARQLRRSAASAAANHRAAGVAGQSHGDFTSKIGIAAGEADESHFWWQHLRDTAAVPVGTLTPLLQEATELSAILRSFTTAKIREEELKRLKKRRRQSS